MIPKNSCKCGSQKDKRAKFCRPCSMTQLAKKCTTCHTTKPIDEFHRNRASADGKNQRCKTCVNGVVNRNRMRSEDPFRLDHEPNLAAICEREDARIARVNNEAFNRLRAAREEVSR